MERVGEPSDSEILLGMVAFLEHVEFEKRQFFTLKLYTDGIVLRV